RRGAVERVVPGNAPEALLPALPEHRVSEPAEFAELAVVEAGEVGRVSQPPMIKFRHGVQPEQIQARHAKMRALHGPIVQPSDAERAAIAHALADDLPRVAEIVAVLPHDLRHVAEVLRLHLTHAKWHPGGE